MQHCKMILLTEMEQLNKPELPPWIWLNNLMILFLGINEEESPPDVTAIIKDLWGKRKPPEALFTLSGDSSGLFCWLSVGSCRCMQQIPPHCLNSYHRVGEFFPEQESQTEDEIKVSPSPPVIHVGAPLMVANLLVWHNWVVGAKSPWESWTPAAMRLQVEHCTCARVCWWVKVLVVCSKHFQA